MTGDLDEIRRIQEEHGHKLDEILAELAGDRHNAGLREDMRTVRRYLNWLGFSISAVATLALATAWGWITKGWPHP